ncbi:MAG: HAD family hydrolase [Ignavibacteriota bacterium]
MKPKAIFFDRDGVINERIIGGYVRAWSEFHFLPDVGETLKVIKQKGYLAIVVTNQRGVGLGLFSQADLDLVHQMMQEELQQKYGVQFDDIIFCTDSDDEPGRRKPSPAMLVEAQNKYSIDLAASWMIGDTHSDILAGTRAGTRTAFVVNEHERTPDSATVVIGSVNEILKYI